MYHRVLSGRIRSFWQASPAQVQIWILKAACGIPIVRMRVDLIADEWKGSTLVTKYHRISDKNSQMTEQSRGNQTSYQEASRSESYDPRQAESLVQKEWDDSSVYVASENSEKQKFYCVPFYDFNCLHICLAQLIQFINFISCLQ